MDPAAAAAVRETTAPPGPQGRGPAALPPLRLQLLGTFAGSLGERPVEAALPPGSRVRELLAYLAWHQAGRRREVIGADLWPDAGAGQEVTVAHTTLHRLRQALFPELILGDAQPHGVYRLNPAAPLDVDVHRFEQLLGAAERTLKDEPQRRALLTKAVAAYSGPFFPECYAEWAVAARRRLERRYVTALAQLVDAEWAAGEYRACLAACVRLLDVEPAEESIHCRLLECYERLEEPLAGILHYRRYARELAGQHQGQRPAPTSAIARRLERLLARLGAGDRAELAPAASWR
jgi:DNA-binding SARP family transcriptional activator